MNFNFYMLRKHMFKKRFNNLHLQEIKLNYGYCSIFSAIKQRFNFVYIRFFKKLIRRSYCKQKVRFFKPRFWFFFKYNYICTMKSKNARMGAGTGSLVRIVMDLQPNYRIVRFKHYSVYFIRKIVNYLQFKCGLSLFYFFKFLH